MGTSPWLTSAVLCLPGVAACLVEPEEEYEWVALSAAIAQGPDDSVSCRDWDCIPPSPPDVYVSVRLGSEQGWTDVVESLDPEWNQRVVGGIRRSSLAQAVEDGRSGIWVMDEDFQALDTPLGSLDQTIGYWPMSLTDAELDDLPLHLTLESEGRVRLDLELRCTFGCGVAADFGVP